MTYDLSSDTTLIQHLPRKLKVECDHLINTFISIDHDKLYYSFQFTEYVERQNEFNHDF
jgi:hypothetical protein